MNIDLQEMIESLKFTDPIKFLDKERINEYGLYDPILIRPIEWRPVIYQDVRLNMYEVSNYGDIRNIYTEKLMSKEVTYTGYHRVCLQLEPPTDNHKGRKVAVHRLVATAFIPNPNNYPMVNHKTCYRGFNAAWELEWCEVRYNTFHGIKHMDSSPRYKELRKRNHRLTGGQLPNTRGENNGCSRWTEAQVHIICEGLEKRLSYRECLELIGEENTVNNRANVSNIVQKKRWKHISCNYNLPKVRSRK